jgi:hypothetical protein
MTNPQLQLPDPLTDNAGILISALQCRTEWGAEQTGVLEQLIDMLGRKRYITFSGHPARYHLTQIGAVLPDGRASQQAWPSHAPSAASESHRLCQLRAIQPAAHGRCFLVVL